MMVLNFVRTILRMPPRARFKNSSQYWDERYRLGGNSGDGSYGQFAEFKAEVLNQFVAAQEIKSVIEFGCGDGNQLSLAKYPSYLGLDVSQFAVDKCRERFRDDSSKAFLLATEGSGQRAELALSLDVIFHLVEDHVFETYMATLFAAAERHVILYTSNFLSGEKLEAANAHFIKAKHVRHRAILEYVANRFPDWELKRHIPNRYPYRWQTDEGSFADFFFFQKVAH
jgi:SAM-dependent methyltransferase